MGVHASKHQQEQEQSHTHVAQAEARAEAKGTKETASRQARKSDLVTGTRWPMNQRTEQCQQEDKPRIGLLFDSCLRKTPFRSRCDSDDGSYSNIDSDSNNHGDRQYDSHHQGLWKGRARSEFAPSTTERHHGTTGSTSTATTISTSDSSSNAAGACRYRHGAPQRSRAAPSSMHESLKPAPSTAPVATSTSTLARPRTAAAARMDRIRATPSPPAGVATTTMASSGDCQGTACSPFHSTQASSSCSSPSSPSRTAAMPLHALPPHRQGHEGQLPHAGHMDTTPSYRRSRSVPIQNPERSSMFSGNTELDSAVSGERELHSRWVDPHHVSESLHGYDFDDTDDNARFLMRLLDDRTSEMYDRIQRHRQKIQRNGPAEAPPPPSDDSSTLDWEGCLDDEDGHDAIDDCDENGENGEMIFLFEF